MWETGTPWGANSPSAVAPPKRSARSWALSVCVIIAYPLAVYLPRTRLRKLVPDQDFLRDHVRWTVLYGVFADGVEGAFVAVAERDHGYHVLPYSRIFDAEGASLVYEPGA